MRRWAGRTNEPLFWGLFGGGGMVSVFLMPVLIVIFAFLVPFGVFGGAEGTYETMHGVLTNWFVALVLFVVLALVLWHAAHRFFHSLHDLKIHPPEIVRVVIYGVALLAPAIGYSLFLVEAATS
ncbi:MAG TPA: fumarate reductase subunit D [Micrococcales bacterium]|uniref:Fumarate reductase subunit D n=1 Tax=Miniimonas arenae TaxID=676201 RepID=A0A5C5BC74_9MICO|nr:MULTISPECIES: fumarate reductase subunit FrdD [Miniimonas]TNU74988.1 fumarate reductase subunit D [Miniimonas arenae]HCX84933.1 fumarate reductase subunit D [Micrococcales bacterium]